PGDHGGLLRRREDDGLHCDAVGPLLEDHMLQAFARPVLPARDDGPAHETDATRDPGPAGWKSPQVRPSGQARALMRRISSALGGAPTMVSLISPSLKKRSVGIACTWYRCASVGSSSTL